MDMLMPTFTALTSSPVPAPVWSRCASKQGESVHSCTQLVPDCRSVKVLGGYRFKDPAQGGRAEAWPLLFLQIHSLQLHA